MAYQKYLDVLVDPAIANQSAVVATVETKLWDTATWTPIPAGDGRANRIYRLVAGGIMSFAATGTLTLTPRFGTTTGGTTFGASVAQTTPGATTNAPWYMTADVIIRVNGAPGANSTAMCNGMFVSNATGTAGTAVCLAFGGTAAASIDLSVASGFFMGWTLSVAGTVTPTHIAWHSVG